MSAYLPESDSEDELPPGWEERSTLEGEVYYANHEMSSTQWSHPRTGRRKKVSENLPFGWERKILPDNKVVYVDLVNKKTTFTDPRLAYARETVTANTSFRQKFDASSTALQVVHGRDLTGHTALVTGANSGVGWETARTLALQGCEVVLACRSEERAGAAIATLRKERPNVRVSHLLMDLASLASVKTAARQFIVDHKKLDYLVLNAGTFPQEYTTTQDGLETIMQVNYLSHFYLVSLLHRVLCSSLTSRVVILSSESHRFSNLSQPDSLQFNPGPTNFIPQFQYNNSKLCCLLLAPALNRRFSHLGLTALALHPGNILPTRLHRHSWFHSIVAALCRPWTKSAAQAAGSVMMAVCGEEFPEHTFYINNCFPTQPDRAACNTKMQEQLWDVTIQCLEQKLGPNCCS